MTVGSANKRIIFGQSPVTELRLSEELPNGDSSVPTWYWHPSLLFPAPKCSYRGHAAAFRGAVADYSL
jgi:hypothetical protein